MRILIAPFEVAGIAGGLKAGFDRIGVEAELASSHPHAFGYADERRSPVVTRIWSRLGHACFSERSSAPAKALLLVAWKAWSLVVLAWALARFDGFVFLFGNTVTNTAAEAWLLAKLRKKVVVIYCGSDSRPPYVDGQVYADPARGTAANVARTAARIARRTARLERHGFVCVNSPFTGHFHTRPYVSWFAMGLPRRVEDQPQSQSAAAGAPLRILHSPSNPAVKGTDRIVAAIEELKRRGHALDLVLLRNLPNEEVLREIARADLVVDQIYSDTPMAGLAAEAAHSGKAVLVAGYAARDDFSEVCRAPAPPTLYVHPDQLGEALERLVTDEALRTRLGRELKAFVEGPWSAEAIAGRYVRLLSGDPPDEWLIRPDWGLYLHGGGISESDARRFVGEIVGACGPAGLHLDRRPELRDAFVAFASEPPR